MRTVVGSHGSQMQPVELTRRTAGTLGDLFQFDVGNHTEPLAPRGNGHGISREFIAIVKGGHWKCRVNPVGIAKVTLWNAMEFKETHDNCHGNKGVPSAPMDSQKSP